jgi:hypothetical protein
VMRGDEPRLLPSGAHQGALRVREPKFEVAWCAGLIRSSAASRMNHDGWPTTILDSRARDITTLVRDVVNELVTRDIRW